MPVDRAPGAYTVTRPTPREHWHAIAREWFESLAPSGQARWFEPSDWSAAVFVAETMSRALSVNKPLSGHTITAILSGMGALMSTEADRRRLRIELERGDQVDADDDASVTVLNDHVKRFTG